MPLSLALDWGPARVQPFGLQPNDTSNIISTNVVRNLLPYESSVNYKGSLA